MNLSEFNFKTFQRGNDFQMKPSIICKDGFKMSVQGSKYHYCDPRETVNDYYSMEVGFPSELEPLIIHKAEDPENPTQTVYGWVDSEIIDAVIVKHGGIDEELTFANKEVPSE